MMVVWRLFFVIGLSAAAQSWTPLNSGTTANLRGVASSGQTAWVSGAMGTVLKTTDGGKTWRNSGPRGVADVDFRDVEAVDERTVFLLSSGQGPQSRIYKTTDGGANWMLLTTSLDQRGFWDCMSFWDSTHGIVVGDPIAGGDGRFTILTTSDGMTWQKLKGPPAMHDEQAFAASGTCVVARGTREAWFGTGVGGARVFHSTDGGQTWSVASTPLRHDSPNSGILSLAFFDALHGIAVGGDFMKPEESVHNVATTADGGKTWVGPSGAAPGGYRSAVWCRDAGVCIAVGTSGADYSSDGGKSWKSFGSEGYNAINGFAVGTNGRIATLVLPGQR
jgi:photosystem II stability/assembly factor-like uncharacterized protein